MIIYQKLLFIFLFFLNVNCTKDLKLHSKTYVAKTGTTCKDGIGVIYTYRVLKFNQKTVTISFRVIASVADNLKDRYEHMYDHLTKRYNFKIDDKIVIIENCNDFGKLKIEKSKLLFRDKNSKQEIHFIEEESK